MFLDIAEEDWKEFGISKVGLLYIRRIKEKVCNCTVVVLGLV